MEKIKLFGADFRLKTLCDSPSQRNPSWKLCGWQELNYFSPWSSCRCHHW